MENRLIISIAPNQPNFGAYDTERLIQFNTDYPQKIGSHFVMWCKKLNKANIDYTVTIVCD